MEITEPLEHTIYDMYMITYDDTSVWVDVTGEDQVVMLEDLMAGTTYYIEVYTSSHGDLSNQRVDTSTTTC